MADHQVDTALVLQQIHIYIQVGMGGHKSNDIFNTDVLATL